MPSGDREAMDNQEIALGSVVRSKAGGPSMTVDSFRDGGEAVICRWFSRDSTLHTESYLVDAVEPTTADPWSQEA